MTLDDLRQHLDTLAKTLPGNTLIVMSQDAEGNGFRVLSEPEPALYFPETDWSGDCYAPDDEDVADDDGGVKAICLWPIN